MGTGRVREDGTEVLVVRVDEVRFTCPGGHLWSVQRDVILAAPAAAETCPECGAIAIDAEIEQHTVHPERRGVVLRLPTAEP